MRYVPHIGDKPVARTQWARHALQFNVEHSKVLRRF